MNAIRNPGQVNQNTTMIDFGMRGAAKAGAVYYIKAGMSCLIDASGSKDEAKRVISYLRANNMELPDIVILTHSHYDHCSGIHALQERAERENRRMEVFASKKEIPLLEDQSHNKAFHPKENYLNIHDVTPLNDGEKIELDGITLSVTNTPGHTPGHISILDEQNKNLFVGCALGLKLSDKAFIPPFMPQFWDMDEYLKSIERIREIDYDSMCMAHFGYIFGVEAHSILDESLSVCKKWWSIFESAEEVGKLDDVDYVVERILTETAMKYPNIGLVDPKLRYGLKVLNATRRIRGKDSLIAAQILMHENVVPWLAKGYRLATNQ
ncbi:MAG: MBL fold metallo-hydrolase [Candidatus Thorarchaeota archaeon]